MKNSKKIFVVLFIMLLFIIIVVFYFFINNKSYKLNLPRLEDLENISLEQDSNVKIINKIEEMEDILYVLNGNGRTTKNRSIQDEPVNIFKKIKIEFDFKETGISTIFLYEKNNKYFIEQPYNGIYRISPDEYNSIEN